MRKILIAIAVMIITLTSYAIAGNNIDWKDAENHYGKYMTVDGMIVSAKCLPKVCFLNFDRDYRKTFTAVIFASDLSKFPPNPDLYFLNKKVRVTGIIKEYKGKPEIILKKPDQIKIVKDE